MAELGAFLLWIIVCVLIPPFFVQIAWNTLTPLTELPIVSIREALAGWFFVILARWFVRSSIVR